MKLLIIFSVLALSTLTQALYGQSAVPHDTIRPVKVDSIDLLVAKRKLFTTAVYKNGEKLSNAAVVSLLQSTPKALNKFQWGNRLKPIGPIISLAGIVLGYMGLKGDEQTAMISGVRTATNSRPPDIQVTYTKRSLPKTLAGLGLFVGGLCLIELANDHTATSITLYNAKPGPIKTLSQVNRLNLGLTTTGNVGLEAHF
ncbi:hypothetical protein [Spirosoma aerolatum]|uniref:hypothetical protein n=1 Tax=Spirosoma aerolatum TaxID=1211326 RepID=UPI0009AE26EF|nr:hypothetical protein [Spirosoma aerolatum]